MYSGRVAFFAARVTADACTSVKTTVGGESVSGTVGPAVFPPFGDQSAAYTANLTVQGQAVTQDIVLVQKGNYLVAVALADTGAVNTTELDGFVTQAVAKVATAPVHPPILQTPPSSGEDS